MRSIQADASSGNISYPHSRTISQADCTLASLGCLNVICSIRWRATQLSPSIKSSLDPPDFSGLDTFATVLLQVHVADLPYTPGLGQPHVLSTVAQTGHHLVDLPWSTHTLWVTAPSTHCNVGFLYYNGILRFNFSINRWKNDEQSTHLSL